MDKRAEEEVNLLEDSCDEMPECKTTSGSGTWATTLRGILALFTVAFLATISRISVQALNKAIPHFQLNALRSATAWIIISLFFLLTKTIPKVSKESFLPVFWFVIVSSAVPVFEYTTVTFIPVAAAQSIVITVALLSGLVLFTLVTKEKITADKVLAAFVCIGGVLLVLQPKFLFYILNRNVENLDDTTVNTTLNEPVSSERNSQSIGYILGICTGFVITLDILTVRYYPGYFSNKNIFIALFWTYTLGTIVSLVVMVIFETPQIPTGCREYFFTGCHLLSYVFILPLFMYGSSVTSGNTANIISTSSIIAMLAAQYTILKDIHPGHRNWIEVLGVFIVLLGGTTSSILELCRSYKSSKY